MPRLRSVLRILCAVVVITMLGWLCWQSIDIFITGTREEIPNNASVYTMADVQRRLARAVPWGLPGLAIIIIACIFHTTPESLSSSRINTPEFHLRRLKSGMKNLPVEATKETAYRKQVRALCTIFLSVCVVHSLIYLLNVNHFTSWDLESVIGNMLIHIAPGMLVSFVTAVIAKHLFIRSIEKEILHLQHHAHRTQPSTGFSEQKEPTHMRTALYLLAIIFVVWGMLNGGLYDVLVKAINICTECIGLG